MARSTIIVGVLLIIVGAIAYVATGMASVTALIPAFFGVPIALLGLAATKPAWRKTAMHVAVVLGVLGLVGALYRPASAVIGGDGLTFGAPLYGQLAMALICLVFVVMCVRSFVAARREPGGMSA